MLLKYWFQCNYQYKLEIVSIFIYPLSTAFRLDFVVYQNKYCNVNKVPNSTFNSKNTHLLG